MACDRHVRRVHGHIFELSNHIGLNAKESQSVFLSLLEHLDEFFHVSFFAQMVFLLFFAFLLEVVIFFHEFIDVLLVPTGNFMLLLSLDLHLVLQPLYLFLFIMKLLGLLPDLVIG